MTKPDSFLHADPFWGNGESQLPPPQGIAAAWVFPKALAGNTHPGAQRPFGMISACAHSGGYPTGYYVNALNTNSRVPKEFARNCARGFAHFHMSGTGMIRVYYNYVLVTPLTEGLSGRTRQHGLIDERANPGYYAATLEESGVRAELTTSRRAALHRYMFPAGAPPEVAIDFSAGGINSSRANAEEALVEITDDGAVRARIVMEGLPIFVHAKSDLATARVALWENEREIADKRLERSQPGTTTFGAVFSTADACCQVNLRIGFSLCGHEQAEANAREPAGFDASRAESETEWQDLLSRVEVEGSDEAKNIFYSCLYHSLVKPADFSGECPFWRDAPYYVDFATLWDVYKTQLPLVLTLYPERARDMVNSLVRTAEHVGHFPNMFLLTGGLRSNEEGQARGLAHHVIYDAWVRGLEGIDWARALRAMVASIERPANADFLEDKLAKPLTHNLDLAGACFCTAELASALGETGIAERMRPRAEQWRTVMDPAACLMIEGDYYEGTRWNYSFRILPDMAARAAAFPSVGKFVENLDSFFGYGAPPVVPRYHSGKEDEQAYSGLHRFEGFNNEPDMETPYAYLFAGRHDRTAEIVRAGMKYQFTTGRGGAPGNVDSGGLSACYVWNAIGLFPATGLPYFMIGSPAFPSATLRLPAGAFHVVAQNHSDTAIYVESAELNGTPLDRAWLTIDEVLRGGTLVLRMAERPSDWARHNPPPSPARAAAR